MNRWNSAWPRLNEYDQEHLSRIALPLGGIGTGTVSLGGRGQLQDWEIMNAPAKGSYLIPPTKGGPRPFFALYAKPANGPSVTRCLEGVLPVELYEGAFGSRQINHGLPRFEDCSFAAAYPFGQVQLHDSAVPVDVRLEAFNPLIPADADRSGIPVAVLRYVLTNRTNQRVKASVCGFLTNPVGQDAEGENRTCFRRGKNVAGLFMDSVGVPETQPQWGTLALTTTARTGITCNIRGAEHDSRWGNETLIFWDDFSADGKLQERHEAKKETRGYLSVSVTIPPKGVKEVTFFLTWRFPNRITWTPKPKEEGSSCCSGNGKKPLPDPEDIVGNYYCSQYRDAWEVAETTAGQLKTLERDSLAFVRAFCASDLPAVVKEAALSNVSTLRTQTCFRTPDGRFFGWEGCCDGDGCCFGNCTHVWNYEQTTAFLFGDLSMTMRDVEFAHATRDNGSMSFRMFLPLERTKTSDPAAAADGQMGCVMKMYRDWQLSGDDEALMRLWPMVRKALEFCWLPGGWDADQDGVMEGCQHNTMDVEYFGPNPQMTGWYLGALRAAEEMARYLGEADFADRCRSLFERGRTWMDENLFNGEYYEHHILPPKRESEIAEGLRLHMGATDLSKPEFQLGEGCLVDQLVGQYFAHICGLGYLHDPRKVRKTLKSILQYNRRENFDAHFNCMRSFAMGQERALLMATYPKERPETPFPYFTEVMTGFEYATATNLIQEGMVKQGVEVISDIRHRYDGRKRNPFNEAECGHHYARAMASWAATLALTGFRYSAVTQTMEFSAREGTHFWSNGYAWGTCRIRKTKKKYDVELTVLQGSLTLKRFALADAGEATFSPAMRWPAGRVKRIVIPVA